MFYILVIFLSVFQVNYSIDAIEISSYARVSRNGDSIIVQSDRGNRNIVQTSDVDSTLIDKNNSQSQHQQDDVVVDDEDGGRQIKSEKSTGRAIESSNYFSPFSNLLSKSPLYPIKSNDESSRRRQVVVYPTSYNNANANYLPRNQQPFNVMMPSTGLQTAQRRFQYTPDKIRPFRGADSPPVYQYPKPTEATKDTPPEKFAGPIVVNDSDSPPGTHFMPTPIPPTDDENPTLTSSGPIIDLFNFPKHVNTSFMPNIHPELDAIKSSIDNNHHHDDETFKFPPNIDSNYLPPEMINNEIIVNSYFPPPSGDDLSLNISNDDDDGIDDNNNKSNNIRPQKDLTNLPLNLSPVYPGQPSPPLTSIQKFKLGENSSHFPSDSGGDDDGDEITPTTYKPVKNLFNFPPNINSNYSSKHSDKVKQRNTENSYLPPPSGDFTNELNLKIIDNSAEDSYTPPEDLFKFPPNVDSSYLPPETDDDDANEPKVDNSYIPPPSGDASNTEKPKEALNELFNFPPNIQSNYGPPENEKPNNIENSYLPPPSGDVVKSSKTIPNSYIPPKSLFKFPPNIDANYLPPSDGDGGGNVDNSYLPPPSGIPSEISNFQSNYQPTPASESANSYIPPPFPPSHIHHHMHEPVANFYSYLPPMPAPTPPPAPIATLPPQNSYLPPEQMPIPMPVAMMMNQIPQGPPTAPDFAKWHGFDPHSDIIYDYDHHHHHHDHDHPPDTTTTTEAPEEPRVKKYSYYYLGRKLWYIPLYFTLWFCLYVVALIIRSIGRHKVDLPNHYVSRSLHDMSNKELIEKINRVTEFSMRQIEEFKEKYL